MSSFTLGSRWNNSKPLRYGVGVECGFGGRIKDERRELSAKHTERQNKNQACQTSSTPLRPIRSRHLLRRRTSEQESKYTRRVKSKNQHFKHRSAGATTFLLFRTFCQIRKCAIAIVRFWLRAMPATIRRDMSRACVQMAACSSSRYRYEWSGFLSSIRNKTSEQADDMRFNSIANSFLLV